MFKFVLDLINGKNARFVDIETANILSNLANIVTQNRSSVMKYVNESDEFRRLSMVNGIYSRGTPIEKIIENIQLKEACKHYKVKNKKVDVKDIINDAEKDFLDAIKKVKEAEKIYCNAMNIPFIDSDDESVASHESTNTKEQKEAQIVPVIHLLTENSYTKPLSDRPDDVIFIDSSSSSVLSSVSNSPNGKNQQQSGSNSAIDASGHDNKSKVKNGFDYSSSRISDESDVSGDSHASTNAKNEQKTPNKPVTNDISKESSTTSSDKQNTAVTGSSFASALNSTSNSSNNKNQKSFESNSTIKQEPVEHKPQEKMNMNDSSSDSSWTSSDDSDSTNLVSSTAASESSLPNTRKVKEENSNENKGPLYQSVYLLAKKEMKSSDQIETPKIETKKQTIISTPTKQSTNSSAKSKIAAQTKMTNYAKHTPEEKPETNGTAQAIKSMQQVLKQSFGSSKNVFSNSLFAVGNQQTPNQNIAQYNPSFYQHFHVFQPQTIPQQNTTAQPFHQQNQQAHATAPTNFNNQLKTI